MGAPPVPADFKLDLGVAFDGLFMLSGGFDHASAEQALHDKRGDSIAFGSPFLADPDLVARLRKDAALNAPDMATSHTPGAKGCTDCPAMTTRTGNTAPGRPVRAAPDLKLQARPWSPSYLARLASWQARANKPAHCTGGGPSHPLCAPAHRRSRGAQLIMRSRFSLVGQCAVDPARRPSGTSSKT